MKRKYNLKAVYSVASKILHQATNLTKYAQYNENYKTLNITKRGKMPYSGTGVLIVKEMLIFTKSIYKFNTMPLKLLLKILHSLTNCF